MGKFFMPAQPGSKQEKFQGIKKKKILPNCNQSLHKTIFALLKKLLTRQVQKTIRKMHDQEHKKDPKVLIQRLQELKAISKPDLKRLSFHILTDELNVESTVLKSLLKKQLKEEQIKLTEGVNNFYNLIKGQNLYKNEVEDAQRLRNKVDQKKKTKKEKSKIKKKIKLTTKKIKANKEQTGDMQEQKNIQESNEKQDILQSGAEEQVIQILKEKKVQLQTKTKSSFWKPKEKQILTEFKKTGRNKFLQQKRQKRDKSNKSKYQTERGRQNQKYQTVDKPAYPDRTQTPHPSWQAKREIKNQMFIQPFQGKRILL